VLAAVLTTLIGAAGPAPPAQARQAYCSPTGDYCTFAVLDEGRRTLGVRTFSFRGRVSICVDPPRGRVTCVRKPLRRDGLGVWEASAVWSRSFPNRGRGVYRVRIYSPFDTRLGPLLSFRA
jgi:hypothetical protein